jgi:hypothetical protein
MNPSVRQRGTWTGTRWGQILPVSGSDLSVMPHHPYRPTLTSMVIVLGVLVAVSLAALLIGAVTGRAKLTSCCAVADPRCDARMRSAFRSPAELNERH